MKGHVPTPPSVVDAMVAKLFAERHPKPTDRVLDPGCGDGVFIEGVLRFCKAHKLMPPKIVGVELNPQLVAEARHKFAGGIAPTVMILEQDYLDAPLDPCDFIIGNPPYVSITGLDAREKKRYRAAFQTAVGRFDLYLLFFERSLTNLRPGGRLVFITPEKFEYVHTAEPLRRLLAQTRIIELEHVHEETFPGLVTYPTITTLVKKSPPAGHTTTILQRDGTKLAVQLPANGVAWSAVLRGQVPSPEGALTLKDVTLRISCGVATGTDEVFVQPEEDLPQGLKPFAYPTLSGRQLGYGEITRESDVAKTRDVMLVPYDKKGVLLPESQLGDLRTYLRRPDIHRKLALRTHVTERGRAYYRFHDNVPLPEILRPKIVCKDIASEPKFWADRKGRIVPRHSVYYIVPKDGVDLDTLLAYLNGDEARAWLKAHVQRAANGFYRLQSTVLKRLPVPDHLGSEGSEVKQPNRTQKQRARSTRTVQSVLRG